MLHYEVNVVPKLFFPATFVENIIKEDLPKNLSAIAKRAEIEAESDGKVVGVLRMLKPSNTQINWKPHCISIITRKWSHQQKRFFRNHESEDEW